MSKNDFSWDIISDINKWSMISFTNLYEENIWISLKIILLEKLQRNSPQIINSLTLIKGSQKLHSDEN